MTLNMCPMCRQFHALQLMWQCGKMFSFRQTTQSRIKEGKLVAHWQPFPVLLDVLLGEGDEGTDMEILMTPSRLQ